MDEMKAIALIKSMLNKPIKEMKSEIENIKGGGAGGSGGDFLTVVFTEGGDMQSSATYQRMHDAFHSGKLGMVILTNYLANESKYGGWDVATRIANQIRTKADGTELMCFVMSRDGGEVLFFEDNSVVFEWWD